MWAACAGLRGGCCLAAGASKPQQQAGRSAPLRCRSGGSHASASLRFEQKRAAPAASGSGAPPLMAQPAAAALGLVGLCAAAAALLPGGLAEAAAEVSAAAPLFDPLKISGQLNQISLLPYLAFLFTLWRSKQAPLLVLAGFCTTLLFVAVAIPAGMWCRQHYGTSLANVDWLHGSCEALLTTANLLIVLGMRGALREAEQRRPGEGQAAGGK